MGYGLMESFPVTCQQVLDFNNDLGKLYKYSGDCKGNADLQASVEKEHPGADLAGLGNMLYDELQCNRPEDGGPWDEFTFVEYMVFSTLMCSEGLIPPAECDCIMKGNCPSGSDMTSGSDFGSGAGPDPSGSTYTPSGSVGSNGGGPGSGYIGSDGQWYPNSGRGSYSGSGSGHSNPSF